LRDIYVDPSVKAVLTEINGYLVSDTTQLAGPGSATAVTNATGGIGAYFSVPQFLAQRAQLASNLVNVNDVGNMSWIQNEFSYHLMLDDTDWVKQTTVGQSVAQAIRGTGEFPTAFSTNLGFDQGFSTVNVSGQPFSYPGAYFHRFAIALASRPQPYVQSSDYLKVIELPIRGLIFRMMMWFDPQANSYKVTVSCMLGHQCIRPDMGVQLSSLVSA
jgi:hypothetical protein